MKDIQKQAALAPKAEDYARECGAVVTHEPNGDWVATVTDRAMIKRAVQMQDPARAVDIERGAKLMARRPTERIVTGEGKTVPFPLHLIDHVATQRGWHAPGKNGGVKVTMTGGWLPNAKDRAEGRG